MDLGSTSQRPKVSAAKKVPTKAKTLTTETVRKSVKPPVYMRSKSAGPRSPRPDVTNLFPFADKEADTDRLLWSRPDGPTFFLLGAAARKRVAEKAFEDYAQGHAALPYSEVSAALSVLGLAVSKELRAMFQEKAITAAKQPGQVPGRVVREDWLKLVEQQVELHRRIMAEEFNKNAADVAKRKMEIAAEIAHEQAQETSEDAIKTASVRSEGDQLVKVLLSSDAMQALGLDEASDALDEEATAAIQMALGKSLWEAHKRLRSMSGEERSEALSSRNRGGKNVTTATRTRWNKALMATGEGARGAAAKVVGGKAVGVPGYKDNFASRVRRTESKIAAQVRADKARTKREGKLTSDSALRALAKEKVDAASGLHYTALDYPDPPAMRKKRPLNKHPLRTSPEDTDLTSGSAASQIADAFLKGEVVQALGGDTLAPTADEPSKSSMVSHKSAAGGGSVSFVGSSSSSSSGSSSSSSGNSSSSSGSSSSSYLDSTDAISVAESQMLLPQSELEAQVERMVQERLDRMKEEREGREPFSKPQGEDIPKNWEEKNKGFVMNVSMTSKTNSAYRR